MDKIIHISEIIRPDFIIDLQSTDKSSALEELLKAIIHSDKITNATKFSKAIRAREKLMSTGIGYGIAVPHARDRSILDFVMAMGRSKKGVKYESIDDQPVQLIFMIGASDSQDKDYIKLLSRLVLRLKNDDLKNKILSADSPSEIYEIIKGTR